MHRSVDAHLAAVTDPGAMEDGSPGRDEYLVLKLCAGHMRVRNDQAMVTDQAGVSGPLAHNGVLHDDGAAADANGATAFSDDASHANMRAPGPMVTSPQIVASGATHASGSNFFPLLQTTFRFGKSDPNKRRRQPRNANV